MSQTQFVLDFSEFFNKFDKIARVAIPDRVEKGMAKAGMQLLNDAIMVEPTVPLKEGYLRGSGSVFVEDRFAGQSHQGKKDFANTASPGVARRYDAWVAIVGFNAPYAARLHEAGGNMNFSEPSAGAKFLESKMNSFKDVYFQIIANTISKG